jgi:hypothetical protein
MSHVRHECYCVHCIIYDHIVRVTGLYKRNVHGVVATTHMSASTVTHAISKLLHYVAHPVRQYQLQRAGAWSSCVPPIAVLCNVSPTKCSRRACIQGCTSDSASRAAAAASSKHHATCSNTAVRPGSPSTAVRTMQLGMACILCIAFDCLSWLHAWSSRAAPSMLLG